ncbi:MAG: peptide chain release factor N(5)-glutamine methyltransferase [bacterium]|nr:peptide chain release factor N(5)-glutamine methyltransferase [bacterium]
MLTLEQVLREGKEVLASALIEEADLDAWYLLEYCFGVTRATYYMDRNAAADPEKYQMYLSLLEKRKMRIPLSQITNSRDFYGFEFYVNENVLTPRQETEILVEEALKICENKSVLDVCTGSGCIIITLSKCATLTKACGVDISEKALEVANKNKQLLEANVTLLQSDLFSNVTGTFDVIVSNPPYIPTKDIDELMPEVRLHEPMLALDGTEDGLEFYRKIIQASHQYLNDNGTIIFEIGYDQGEAVSTLLKEAGYIDVKVIKDLTGRDRVVSGRLLQ